MRKWILGAALICMLAGSPVAYAHIVGVFGDFLAGVQDESTTEKLKREIQETKEEIAYLTPKLQKYQKQYAEKENFAVTKLQFYSAMGLDTMMNFILESHDVTDALANQHLMEKNIEEYLQELHALYLDYMQLKVTKESLEGHKQLLQTIQSNLEARNAYIDQHWDPAQNAEENEQQISERVADLWQEEASSLDDYLLNDSRYLSGNLQNLFTRQTKDSPYRLSEKTLNAVTRLDYHLRSDHIYVHYKRQRADVILIGTMSKKSDRKAHLTFEAGFINGFHISSRILGKLVGLEIDYSMLNPDSKGFYIEQANGTIAIQAVEKAAE